VWAGVGEMESVPAKQIGIRVILPVRGRDAHAVGVAQFAARCDEPIDDVSKLLAVVAGDSIAIPIERGTRETDLASTDKDRRACEADDARGRVPGFVVADPEQEVDVRLVRSLVVPESRVPVDPEQRAPRSEDPRVAPGARFVAAPASAHRRTSRPESRCSVDTARDFC